MRLWASESVQPRLRTRYRREFSEVGFYRDRLSRIARELDLQMLHGLNIHCPFAHSTVRRAISYSIDCFPVCSCTGSSRRGAVTVSYTHLDVYKRQIQSGVIGNSDNVARCHHQTVTLNVFQRFNSHTKLLVNG